MIKINPTKKHEIDCILDDIDSALRLHNLVAVNTLSKNKNFLFCEYAPALYVIWFFVVMSYSREWFFYLSS